MKQLGLLYLILLNIFAWSARGQSADTTGKPITSQLQLARCADDLLVYPNPAGNELNIVYDVSIEVKNIAVYNLIGKMVAVYKVTGTNSANLNLEALTPGIYFVRLYNAQGEVVLARRFTRQ